MKRDRVVIGLVCLWMAAAAVLPRAQVAAAASESAGDGLTMPAIVPSCMVLPAYPEPERSAGTEGTVFLNVVVKADGKVGSLKADREVEGHPAFTAAAITAVRKWCFEPARKDGIAVDCTVTIPVRFALDEKKKQ